MGSESVSNETSSATFQNLPEEGTLSRELSSNRAIPMDSMRSMLMSKAMADKSNPIDLQGAMRAKMESAFGIDIGGVNLYESERVADAGANAIAQGGNIAFAPGKADFNSMDGKIRLGHELSHIASQARGQVTGSGFLNNASLEARADHEGAIAAAGGQVYSGPMIAAPSFSASAPMQADLPGEDEEEKEEEEQKSALEQGYEWVKFGADLTEHAPDEDFFKGIGVSPKDLGKSPALGNVAKGAGIAKNIATLVNAPEELAEGVGNTMNQYNRGDTVGAIQQGLQTGAGALDTAKSGVELLGGEADFLETGQKALKVGSNALGTAANAKRASELNAMLEQMETNIKAKTERGEPVSEREKVMLAITRQAARNASVQAWSSGVKAGGGLVDMVKKSPGVGTVTKFVTGTTEDVVEGELKKSLVTDTLNDEFDFDNYVRENQGSDFFKQAKHKVLAEQGATTGKRKELFLRNSLERAGALKDLGDKGDETVLALLNAMGVNKGENGYDAALIGQRLGMEEGTQEELEKYRATHTPNTKKLVADTSFHRGIKHATNNAEKALNSVTLGAGGWLADKLSFLKTGRQKNIQKKMRQIEGK